MGRWSRRLARRLVSWLRLPRRSSLARRRLWHGRSHGRDLQSRRSRLRTGVRSGGAFRRPRSQAFSGRPGLVRRRGFRRPSRRAGRLRQHRLTSRPQLLSRSRGCRSGDACSRSRAGDGLRVRVGLCRRGCSSSAVSGMRRRRSMQRPGSSTKACASPSAAPTPSATCFARVVSATSAARRSRSQRSSPASRTTGIPCSAVPVPPLPTSHHSTLIVAQHWLGDSNGLLQPGAGTHCAERPRVGRARSARAE